MNDHDFFHFAKCRFINCLKTLKGKSNEYSRANDKLHNFKAAGRKRDITPERALDGMALKHEISIDDIINDIDAGKLPARDVLTEKIIDRINYLVLLNALIEERIQRADLEKLYEK